MRITIQGDIMNIKTILWEELLMNKLTALISIFGVVLLLLVAISCKKQQDNIHKLGFWGMASYGNPIKQMSSNVAFINSFYIKNQKYPSTKLMRKRIAPNLRFIFYSYSNINKCFQLSWWSGETTWIYDSNTNIYYETKLDLMHSEWFSTDEHKHKRPEDIKSINLYSKKKVKSRSRGKIYGRG